MTLSKKEQYKRLNSYTENKWIEVLEPITNIHLKRKLACILFWDFYGEIDKKSIYLKKLSREYFPKSHDIFVTEDALYIGLLAIGYPALRAKIRSTTPKTH